MFKKLFNVDKMVEQEKQQLLEAQQRVEKREQELKNLQQQVLDRENTLLGSQQEVNQLHELAEKQKKELASKLLETQSKLDSLAQKEQELDNELANVQYLDECGFYTDLNQLVFTYGTSQEYKQAIQDNLNAQKEMITKNLVCKWETTWTVGNSVSKGETMMKDTSKMTIRCFNAECNAIIEHMNRTTLDKVNEKIKKSFNQINKLQKTRNMSMDEKYLELKLEQAKLVYEQQLKNKEERELEVQRRAELREQEKLEKEIQKEKDKALKEKQQYLKEMARLTRQKEQTQELLDRIAELEAQVNSIDETIDNLDERGSVQCKAGWVYVISQPGSEDVKIGTTRRLDPHERIKELGSASVPFKFNTHAVLFAEDAFALENKLHKYFNDKRVNKANVRKEFFHVDVKEVAEYVHANIDAHVEFDFNPINEEYEISIRG
jgi:hypothetical protein